MTYRERRLWSNGGEWRSRCWGAGQPEAPHRASHTLPFHTPTLPQEERGGTLPGSLMLGASLLPSAPAHGCKLQQARLLFVVMGASNAWRLGLLELEFIGFYSIFSCLPCPY